MSRIVKSIGWLKRRFAFLKPMVFMVMGAPDPRLAFKAHALRLSDQGLSRGETMSEAQRLLQIAKSGNLLTDAEDWCHIGKAFLSFDETAQAFEAFNMGISIDHQTADLAAASLASYAFKQPNPSVAIEALYNDASKYQTRQDVTLFGAQFYLQCAMEYLRKGEIESSLHMFATGVAIDPIIASAYSQPFIACLIKQLDPDICFDRVLETFRAARALPRKKWEPIFYFSCACELLKAEQLKIALKSIGLPDQTT